ncbi:MAG: IS200/IS605 family transposase [Thermomicrobiales bacterium]
MAYWRLFYHLVWSTSERRQLLHGEVKGLVEGSVRTICREQKVLIHGLGIQPEHVHLVASIPPSVAISAFVGRAKGSTSHLVNQVAPLKDDRFAWQDEYGVFSFGEKFLPDVVAYVENQEERHRTQRLWEALERTSEDISRLQPGSFGQRGV